MSKYYGVDPILKEAIEASIELEDFTVWSRSGDGRWVDLMDMEEMIHVNVWLKEGRAMCQVVAAIRGFGGLIKGIEMSLPNKHLHTEIMQVLTILEFLPRNENINDHTYKVHMRWMKEERERKAKEEQKILSSLLDTYNSCIDDAVYKAELSNEWGVDILDKRFFEKVARKMRRSNEND